MLRQRIGTDVTHIQDVRVGTVATLIGADGDERVSVEQLASWMGMINYEVVSCIHLSQPRFVVEGEPLSETSELSELPLSTGN